MKRLTHLIAFSLAAAVAAGAAFAHAQPDDERGEGKRGDTRNARLEPFDRSGSFGKREPFNRNDMPRWLPKDDHKQIERIIEEFARGDLHRAESRWESLIRRQPYASRPHDTRRLADYIYLSVRDGSHEKHIRLEDKARFHAERRAAADAQLRSLRRALPEARECGYADVVAYSLNRHWSLGAPAVRERRIERMTYGRIRSSLSWWEREAERIEGDWLRAARELHDYERKHDAWWAHNGDHCRRAIYAHLPY